MRRVQRHDVTVGRRGRVELRHRGAQAPRRPVPRQRAAHRHRLRGGREQDADAALEDGAAHLVGHGPDVAGERDEQRAVLVPDQLRPRRETLVQPRPAAVRGDGHAARPGGPAAERGEMRLQRVAQRVRPARRPRRLGEVVEQELARGRALERGQEVGGRGRLAGEEGDPVLQAERDVGPGLRAVERDPRAHAVRQPLRLEPQQGVARAQPPHAGADERQRGGRRDPLLHLLDERGHQQAVRLHRDGGVGEVEHHGVEAVGAERLDQVLLVQQGVQLVPAHRVVEVEPLDDDHRVHELRAPRRQVDVGVARCVLAREGHARRHVQRVVRRRRRERRHLEGGARLGHRAVGAGEPRLQGARARLRVAHAHALAEADRPEAPAVGEVDEQPARGAPLEEAPLGVQREQHVPTPVGPRHERRHRRRPRPHERRGGAGLEPAVREAQRAVGACVRAHALEGAVEERERDHARPPRRAHVRAERGEVGPRRGRERGAPQLVPGLPPARGVHHGSRGRAVEGLDAGERQHPVVEHAGAHERFERTQGLGERGAGRPVEGRGGPGSAGQRREQREEAGHPERGEHAGPPGGRRRAGRQRR